MEEFLVILEVSKKQTYIFKSNKLKENIGASIIIREVTEELPERILRYKEINGSKENNYVFAGGGKSMFRFESEIKAKTFIEAYSKIIIQEYQGIEVYITSQKYNKNKESIIVAIDKLYSKLEEKKLLKTGTFRLYGFGINEICSSSNTPINIKEGDKISDYSFETQNKIKKSEGKSNDFNDLLPKELKQQGFTFAKKEEELGGIKDEKRYMAVVVLDGNKMGRKIESFKEDYKFINENPSIKLNEKYSEEFRKLSDSIDEVYKFAFKKMILDIKNNMSSWQENEILSLKEKTIPIRPLIQAGDDMCFIVDAKIAIACVERLLKYISEKPVIYYVKGEKKEFSLKASAGVAMVKVGYPFFKAHKLAEELCKNAKSILQKNEDESIIDFHIVQGEIGENITKIREKKYDNGRLTLKPYYLEKEGKINCIKNLKEVLNRIKAENLSRSSIKELRDKLREGENKANKYIHDKRLKLYIEGLEGVKRYSEGCFYNDKCVIFDAIEIMDIYNEMKK